AYVLPVFILLVVYFSGLTLVGHTFYSCSYILPVIILLFIYFTGHHLAVHILYRWGSGRTAGAIDTQKLRFEIERADHEKKLKQLEELNPRYGRKLCVQSDRIDKSAVSYDYQGKLEKLASQTVYSTGFGGKFGVQADRLDKSAAGWDYLEKVEKHASQKNFTTKGCKGFGGKFGVQSDRQDKSAVGWDHKEASQKHKSQLDHKIGFGGKFGIQKDRMDKSAIAYDESTKQVRTNYTKVRPVIEGAKPSNLRAKSENLAKSTEGDTRKRAEEQKRLRETKDKCDQGETAKQAVAKNKPQQAAEENCLPPAKGVRTIIVTGLQVGICNAISAFNQMQSPSKEATDTSRKEPIHIPREPSKVADLIPSIEIQTVFTPPSKVQLQEPSGRVNIKTE
uniref:Cortactin n=1 Tax=Glossina palpalis gambiensis TaxID=67801 RepID=A0A1B0BA73_9MUSC